MPEAIEGVDPPAPAHAFLRSLWHPGILLAVLDLIGLLIATYLSFVELRGEAPTCGIVRGCEEVALSEYARIDTAARTVGRSAVLASAFAAGSSG